MIAAAVLNDNKFITKSMPRNGSLMADDLRHQCHLDATDAHRTGTTRCGRRSPHLVSFVTARSVYSVQATETTGGCAEPSEAVRMPRIWENTWASKRRRTAQALLPRTISPPAPPVTLEKRPRNLSPRALNDSKSERPARGGKADSARTTNLLENQEL